MTTYGISFASVASRPPASLRWDACAARTLEVYRFVAGKSSPLPVFSGQSPVPAESWPRPARRLVHVVSPSAGIGDHLLSLSVAEGYRRRHPGCEISLITRASAHPWLSLFRRARLPGGHRLAAGCPYGRARCGRSAL